MKKVTDVEQVFTRIDGLIYGQKVSAKFCIQRQSCLSGKPDFNKDQLVKKNPNASTNESLIYVLPIHLQVCP